MYLNVRGLPAQLQNHDIRNESRTKKYKMMLKQAPKACRESSVYKGGGCSPRSAVSFNCITVNILLSRRIERAQKHSRDRRTINVVENILYFF